MHLIHVRAYWQKQGIALCAPCAEGRTFAAVLIQYLIAFFRNLITTVEKQRINIILFGVRSYMKNYMMIFVMDMGIQLMTESHVDDIECRDGKIFSAVAKRERHLLDTPRPLLRELWQDTMQSDMQGGLNLLHYLIALQ